MTQITGTATFVTDQERLDFFADKHGYRATSLDPETQQDVPNPETKNEFVTRVIKQELLKILGLPYSREINRQARVSVREQMNALESELDASLNVSISE